MPVARDPAPFPENFQWDLGRIFTSPTVAGAARDLGLSARTRFPFHPLRGTVIPTLTGFASTVQNDKIKRPLSERHRSILLCQEDRARRIWTLVKTEILRVVLKAAAQRREKNGFTIDR